MPYTIGDREAAILEDAVRRVRNMRAGAGIVITNSPQGIVISLAPVKKGSTPAPLSTITALITAVSSGTYEDNSGQWTYTGNIVGGATGVTLRNLCECTSGDVGPNSRYGNGIWIVKTTGRVVDSDCFIVPLGVGITVQCWPDPDHEGDYAFSLPNSAEVPQPP